MALWTVEWTARDRVPQLTGAATLALGAALVLRITGVPPVEVHGPLHYVGVMDPLCGGTRATFLLLTGDAIAAARYNPLVFPLAVAVVILLVRATVGVLTGRWLELVSSRSMRRALLAVILVGIAVLAVRQQLQADLLMGRWPAPDPK